MCQDGIHNKEIIMLWSGVGSRLKPVIGIIYDVHVPVIIKTPQQSLLSVHFALSAKSAEHHWFCVCTVVTTINRKDFLIETIEILSKRTVIVKHNLTW